VSIGLSRFASRRLTAAVCSSSGSTSAIAASVFLGEATVKTHLARIRSKPGLWDRVQAVVLGNESGLVQPGSATNPADTVTVRSSQVWRWTWLHAARTSSRRRAGVKGCLVMAWNVGTTATAAADRERARTSNLGLVERQPPGAALDLACP
jgi:hypothetical protein